MENKKLLEKLVKKLKKDVKPHQRTEKFFLLLRQMNNFPEILDDLNSKYLWVKDQLIYEGNEELEFIKKNVDKRAIFQSAKGFHNIYDKLSFYEYSDINIYDIKKYNNFWERNDILPNVDLS